ncbi:hypothetical protein Fmac_027086 [Flemingia macrophylla]|uniref:Uncharacterized protein n=1 Tax=Flemingia macrophylla TaxID=520843 RepID=A0ABD1LGP5_9FABA
MVKNDEKCWIWWQKGATLDLFFVLTKGSFHSFNGVRILGIGGYTDKIEKAEREREREKVCG